MGDADKGETENSRKKRPAQIRLSPEQIPKNSECVECRHIRIVPPTGPVHDIVVFPSELTPQDNTGGQNQPEDETRSAPKCLRISNHDRTKVCPAAVAKRPSSSCGGLTNAKIAAPTEQT